MLISVGVLMFAFVGYQLWGTGIQTAQAQNRLEDEFEELLAAPVPTDPVATAPVTTAAEPVTPATTAPDPAPTVAPTTTVAPAALQPPRLGEPLARLEIPSIDLDRIVIAGVRSSDLQDGPGHFPETPLPGQLGNAAIAGHRTTHGQPFFRIDEVAVGDDIVVETLAGRFTYVVTGQQIVSPDDYQLVIPTVDPSVATITLTSCHPKFSARQRIVVTAALDPDRSDAVTEAWFTRPPIDPDGLIPGDEPDTTEPGATAPSTTEPATTAPSTTGPATTGPATTAAPDQPTAPGEGIVAGGAAEGTGQELFENRWFSDPDAFVQVALWGAALTAVAIGATLLSRRTRRNWVGALVGAGPFVVVLYFWFENVNRLLPPNL